MHPLPNSLLCQIVCLSFDFDDVVVDAKQGVGGVFTVVHRETELLCAFASGGGLFLACSLSFWHLRAHTAFQSWRTNSTYLPPFPCQHFACYSDCHILLQIVLAVPGSWAGWSALVIRFIPVTRFFIKLYANL
jgi:hypothetical protein